MATIIRVQGNRLELAIPLQTVTMTPNGKVTEDYNVPADAEVKVVLLSSWKTYGFEPLSISGNVVTMRDDGKLPAGKYAVEVRIRQADGTPLRSKYCNIIDIRDCNDGVTQEYDDFIEGSVTLDAQIFWFAKGDDGITPHIDETTGNWFIGDEDTGVHAQGEAGTTDYNELDNKPDLSIYVEKDGDKVLSDNNYTDEEKTKLAGLENYDDTNVLNLIEQTNQNFANYYTKAQTYSQSEVNQLLETQRQGQYVMVEELPEASADTQFKIYLVPSEDAEQGNIKDEYITIDNGSGVTTRYTWEKIGSTDVDLSGYSTTEEMNAAIQTALADYYTKTEADTLLGGKQDTISDLSTIRSGASAGATAYQKPQAGIPKTDLAQDVKDSLDKADSALQEDTLYEDANGHDYVEIGGMKWATKNIGAENITDAGLYFQWGDIQGYTAEQVGTGEGQKYFGWADYKYGNGTSSPGAREMTKYNSTDGKTVLDLEDDAARANWGGTWRMPTTEEMQAFGDAVNAVWTADYQGSGVAGLVCTDKTDNTKVVFFPAAGYCGSGRHVGRYGYCWSSSLFTSSRQGAYDLNFDSYGANWAYNDSRYFGCAVRPILDTTQLKKDLDSKANTEDLADVAFSGSYNDLKNKPTIPTVPTNVSAFNNDAGYLTQHQDISGKANKSEMSVVDGTGANADKTTITLKNGTSATVLKSHQDISGKQDTLVSGSNIKTINNQSLLGSGNITIEGGSTYVPTLQSAPTTSTTTYTKDGQTVDFVVGQFARVANQDNPTGYDMWQLYDLVTSSSVTMAVWRSTDAVIGNINTILDNINGEVI